MLGQSMLDDRKAISIDAKWYYKYEPQKLPMFCKKTCS